MNIPRCRIQCWDGGVQEHLVYRMGRGRPGKAAAPVAALLHQHIRHCVRGWLQRPRQTVRGEARARRDGERLQDLETWKWLSLSSYHLVFVNIFTFICVNATTRIKRLHSGWIRFTEGNQPRLWVGRKDEATLMFVYQVGVKRSKVSIKDVIYLWWSYLDQCQSSVSQSNLHSRDLSDPDHLSSIVAEVGGSKAIWQVAYSSWVRSQLYVIFSSSSSSQLRDEEVAGCPLLVLANKRDLPCAAPLATITDSLGLHTLQREWHIQPTCAPTSDGIYEGLDWLTTKLR